MALLTAALATLASFHGGNGNSENRLLNEDDASRIKRAVEDRERRLGELRAELDDIQWKKSDAEALRQRVRFAAMVDRDPEAEAQLRDATAVMEAAQRDEEDLVTTIAQLEADMVNLKREFAAELKAVGRRQAEAEMKALAAKRLARAPEMQACLDRLVALLAETRSDAGQMQNLAVRLGDIAPHRWNADSALAEWLQIHLSKVLAHHFTCRGALAKHYGHPLDSIERNRLAAYLDEQPLRKEDQPGEATTAS